MKQKDYIIAGLVLLGAYWLAKGAFGKQIALDAAAARYGVTSGSAQDQMLAEQDKGLY